MLEMYAHMVDEAKDLSCITLAFGISDVFKQLLKDNARDSHIAFFLLEKEDKPNTSSKKEFVGLTRGQQRLQGVGVISPSSC